MLIRRQIIVGTALLIWLSGCSALPRTRVDVPSGVLDGGRVPVLVSCSPPLRSGETLILKTAAGTVCRVRPFDGFLLSGFGTNVRLLAPGAIEAVVQSAGSRRSESGRRIELSRKGVIPDSGMSSKQSRVRVEDGRVDLWFDNAMSATNFLREVTVKTNVGGVRIVNTPYIAAKPLYRIITPLSIKRIDVSTMVPSDLKVREKNRGE